MRAAIFASCMIICGAFSPRIATEDGGIGMAIMLFIFIVMDMIELSKNNKHKG